MTHPLATADWARYDQPAVSALTAGQNWCSVQCYSPTVVRTDGGYRMWFLGDDDYSHDHRFRLGTATSEDGVTWTVSPESPVLDSADLPWAEFLQTPFVGYDADADAFEMWFTGATHSRDEEGALVAFEQALGYATSDDGLDWTVRDEPIYPSGRSPCVHRRGPDDYHLWMNSLPDPDDPWEELVSNIYHFTSSDGLGWHRDPEPILSAPGARDTDRPEHRGQNPGSRLRPSKIDTAIYPFTLRVDGEYVMWYGCHVDDTILELFCSTSEDGEQWVHHHDAPAFAATRDRNDFDGLLVSTPRVVDDGDRYLLYYSARDWDNLYVDRDGNVRSSGVFDKSPYRHIGVAETPKR